MSTITIMSVLPHLLNQLMLHFLLTQVQHQHYQLHKQGIKGDNNPGNNK